MTDIETLRWTAKHWLPLHQRDWLKGGLKHLRKDFRQIGHTIPWHIHIQVKYPNSAVDYNWLGSCTHITDSHIIHINPTSTSLCALDTLVHELAYAVAGVEDGHGDEFRRVAAAIGMDDRGIASSAKEVLMKRLVEIRNILGPYPLVTDCLEEANDIGDY